MRRGVLISFILVALGCAVSCRETPPVMAYSQISLWSAADSGRVRFTLSELQGLPEWTALHVFAPYTPVASIRAKLNFEWPEARGFRLEMRDDMHLAVFVSGTKVVRVEEWKRSDFDCSRALTQHALVPGTIVQIDRTTGFPTLTLVDPESVALLRDLGLVLGVLCENGLKPSSDIAGYLGKVLFPFVPFGAFCKIDSVCSNP
jgi:hypothetical protein